MRKTMRKGVGSIILFVTMTAGFVVVPGVVTAQNDPPVANAGGPYASSEGALVVFDASGSTDPNSDPLQYRWDFQNDGVWDTAYSSQPTASYTWYDDYTGTAALNVTDGQFEVTATATVTVTNVAPMIFGLENITVDEGGMIVLQPYVFDPGPLDIVHSTANYQQATGGTSPGNCQQETPDGLPELILNDVTYGSVHLDTTLKTNDYQVVKLDIEGTIGTLLEVSVQGVDVPINQIKDVASYTFTSTLAPDTVIGNVLIDIEPAMVGPTGVKKEVWEVQYEIYEPDGSDPDQDPDLVSWGHFTNATFFYPFVIRKPTPDDCGSPFHILNFTMKDDDGGVSYYDLKIYVKNVPPEVVAGSDKTVKVGDSVSFDGRFSDPGWLDTHNITWDFGDGEVVTGTLAPTHTYSSPRKYVVTLTVTDDDGGVGSDTLVVTVEGEPPSIALLASLALIIALLATVAILVRIIKVKKSQETTAEKESPE